VERVTDKKGGLVMAKGQTRSNREIRKPKKDAPKKVAATSAMSASSLLPKSSKGKSGR
jgi:hypothetical protein